jgi:hypothetical protein
MCNTSRAAAWCCECQQWVKTVVDYTDQDKEDKHRKVEAVVECPGCGELYRVPVADADRLETR